MIEVVTVEREVTVVTTSETTAEIIEVNSPVTVVSVAEVGPQGAAGPRGLSGSAGTGSTKHTAPLEAANSLRTIFTTPDNFTSGSLVVYLNGLVESYVSELEGNQFVFEEAPLTGDTIRVVYTVSA